MKKIFEKIWEIALPFQDVRDDDGHAESVTHFAVELLKCEPGDEDVVIPAAILHDTGWSQMSEEERFYIFKNGITKERELQMDAKVDVRVKHEEEGVKMVKEILGKISYAEDKINRIIEIVRQHDTNKNAINNEDRIMKDADKLWTFSLKGIEADVRRFGFSKQKCFVMAENRIDLENYFHTESAKRIAREELMKRIREMHL